MAAPDDVHILDLNGRWFLDKKLADSFKPVLELQGISWLLRKAISSASLGLFIKEYADSGDSSIWNIELDQIATGGITTKENRITDWKERSGKDMVFGSTTAQNRLVYGRVDGEGKLRPDVDVKTQVSNSDANEKIRRFLRGEILKDGAPTPGYIPTKGADETIWLQSWIRNTDKGYGWTMEYVWGFESVDGERYYTQRVVVADGKGNHEMARYVFGFSGRK